LVTKGETQWIFNPSSRKSYCLSFTGIYNNYDFFMSTKLYANSTMNRPVKKITALKAVNKVG